MKYPYARQKLSEAVGCLCGLGTIQKRLKYVQVSLLPLNATHFPSSHAASLRLLKNDLDSTDFAKLNDDKANDLAKRILQLSEDVWSEELSEQ